MYSSRRLRLNRTGVFKLFIIITTRQRKQTNPQVKVTCYLNSVGSGVAKSLARLPAASWVPGLNLSRAFWRALEAIGRVYANRKVLCTMVHIHCEVTHIIPPTQQKRSDLCNHRNETAWPHSKFPHSCFFIIDT
jgi:hypothetical protein